MEDEIFELISRLITTLHDLAIDERHTPHLYARFLASLLMRHRKGGSAVAGRLQHIPPQSKVSHQSQPHNFPSNPSLSSSGTGYSGAAVPGTLQQGRDNDVMQMSLNRGTSSSLTQALTPPPGTAMHSEDAYALARPPVVTNRVPNDNMDVGMADIVSEHGPPAAMQPLNDDWWRNMMMPGYVSCCLRFSAAWLIFQPQRFSWPEGAHLNGVSESYNDGIPGIHPGFGGYMTEPQLAV